MKAPGSAMPFRVKLPRPLYILSLVLTGGLCSCAAPRQPVADLPMLWGKADAAYAKLPDEDDEYNEALDQLTQALEGKKVDALESQLRDHGVALELPDIGLPLVGFHALPERDGLHLGEDAVGAPVIVEFDTADSPRNPPEGLLMWGTALYRRNAAGQPEFALLAGQDRAKIGAGEYDLRTNYRAPGRETARRARAFARSGFSSMINPAGMDRDPQIYMLDPYDPNKHIVLMVHGLQSTPVTFIRLVNTLRADPEMRRNYQIWQFHYATGTPVMLNAMLLREHLERSIREVDPDGRDFATNHIVALGHSMGGLLCHTLVSDSHSDVWHSIFCVPPTKVVGENQEDFNLYVNVMHFKRNPRIRRVVFMAVPHRGSPMSSSPVGLVGSALTRLPAKFVGGINSLARDNPETMTAPALAFYNGTPFSAIRTLSPRNPSLIALADLPVMVPYHTIIGQLRRGPKEESSDGVVPYTSAHMEGAESELVVRGGHNIFNEPRAMDEIIRILELELRD